MSDPLDELTPPGCTCMPADEPGVLCEICLFVEQFLELLQRCRPFVWRAMQGGKAPHAQDKEDATLLWPLIKDLGK